MALYRSFKLADASSNTMQNLVGGSFHFQFSTSNDGGAFFRQLIEEPPPKVALGLPVLALFGTDASGQWDVWWWWHDV